MGLPTPAGPAGQRAARAAGPQVDDPRQRLASPQRGRGSLHDFNRFDVLYGQAIQIQRPPAAPDDGLAIDQDQGVGGVESLQLDSGTQEVGQVHARLFRQQVRQAQRAPRSDPFGLDDPGGDGNVLQHRGRTSGRDNQGLERYLPEGVGRRLPD
ncbi:MAG: hypothetical protein O2899_00125 [Bacteroidetes bacterium]|nr:hypothetical protein [Bacteroidota bacterium]